MLNTASTDPRALMLMALTVLIWGSGWVVMKFLVDYIGPFDLVAVRYALGFFTLLAIVLFQRRPLGFPPFWYTIGIAVFQTTAYQCLVQMALITGGTGKVVMVAYTLPFWVALFAWALLGERPKRNHVVGFMLAGVGLLAVIGPWKGLGLFSSFLALCGGIAWAIGTVLSKMMFQRHRPDVLSLTMWQMLLGTFFTLPFVWFYQDQPIVWQPATVWGILYLGVFASALAWALWLFVVRRVEATVAGMSSLGVPVLAIVLAWVVLGEQPGPIELTGMVLMLAGLVAVNLPADVLSRRGPKQATVSR